MELGSNFSARLEPFLLMSKSAKGAAAAKLIQDATSAPGVFVFSELLDLPNIQELSNNEQNAKSLDLLQLFAYKTFQDYSRHKDSLPSLNNAQIVKLKHLTIVSMATEKRILPYSDLLTALNMTSVRELEDLIIDAIYLDMLRGKLDQKEGQFEVEYTMGRDLEPGKLESVLAALQHWTSTTSDVLSTLDTKIGEVSRNAAQQKEFKDGHDKYIQELLKEIRDKDTTSTSGSSKGSIIGGLMANSRRNAADKDNKDRMDVDLEPSEGKGKNRKAPQGGDAKPQRKRNRF